jgi:nucleoside-diphosphate-sugar epimerase
MRIFITGASGCIGHYIVDLLIKNTEHELFLLVRNRAKLKFDDRVREGIHIIEGDLANVLEHQNLLKTINVAILVATCWGGEKESYQINVEANLNIINSLSPDICRQIIYFSTASILDQENQLLDEAGEFGTDYIKTKYQCFTQLQKLELASKIITIYPTLVFGGDKDKPYSHLSSGLNDLLKWMNIIRWFQADGSFHFIHGQDIAQVVCYLVNNGKNLDKKYHNKLVVANEPLTVNQAIQEICHYLDKPIYFQIPLSIWLANIFIKLFNIQMAKWDYFCLNYRHFTYKEFVNPQTFHLNYYTPNLDRLMEVSSVLPK